MRQNWHPDLLSVDGPRPVPDFTSAATRDRLTPVAISGVLPILEAWRVKSEDARMLFGDIAERSWYRLKAGTWSGTLTQDQLMRASALVGIYKGLHLLFIGALADEWPLLPNAGAPFDGQTPVQHMVRGGIPTLLETRQHVDGLRGGL